jgi:hypothetical protein
MKKLNWKPATRAADLSRPPSSKKAEIQNSRLDKGISHRRQHVSTSLLPPREEQEEFTENPSPQRKHKKVYQMENSRNLELPFRHSNHSLLSSKSIPYITKPEQPEFSRDENFIPALHPRNGNYIPSLRPPTHLLWTNHTKSIHKRPIFKRVLLQQQSGSSLYPSTTFRESTAKEPKPDTKSIPTGTNLQPLTYPFRYTVPSSIINKQNKSQRVFQHRAHHKKKTEKYNENIPTRQLIHRLRQRCLKAYGLIANPSASL